MSQNATGSEMLPAAETHPTLLAIGIAVTVLDGIHDEPLEYVLRRGYAAMGMAPGLAAKMCQRLADCQTEDATTLIARAERAEAEIARLRAENAGLREQMGQVAMLSHEELHLARQWFESVEDCNSQYLGAQDAGLATRIYQVLGWRVPHRVTARAALSSEPQAAADGGRG